MKTQLEALKQNLSELGTSKLCVAFSGGVDSTVLLSVAKQMGFEILAVTFETYLHPHGDMEEAKQLAKQIGVEHFVIQIDEMTNPKVIQNPPDRCYHCKHMLFTTLKEIAKERGFDIICDGTNADDLKEYRPGLQALSELAIKSPLAECGFTKQEVRGLASELGLQVANKPSTPCLATRLPYHTIVTKDILRKIEAGETFLKQFGFYNIRLRVHETLARVEVDEDSFDTLLLHRKEIIKGLNELGFEQITMDLQGFRSGCYDTPFQFDSEQEKD